MLQRIQTLFLAITVLGAGVFLATNSWTKTIGADEQVTINPYYFTHVKGSLAVEKEPIFYIATLTALAILFTIFTIFQYKNRVRQMLFVSLNSLLLGVAMALTVYQITQKGIPMGDASDSGTYGIGLGAIFAALISNWVANRFIRKDEKLVRSADRMR